MTIDIQESLNQNIKIVVPRVGEQLKGRVLFKKHTQVFVDLGALGTGLIYGQAFYDAQHILKNIKQGEEILVQITDLENEDGYIELSLKEASKELIWQNFKKKKDNGEILKVKINKANRGGLLTTIDGVTAFLPVSQLSFGHYPRVDDSDKNKIFSELQKFVDQEVEVKIIDLDAQNNKLILSEKEVGDEELEKLLKTLKIGDIVEGVVSRITDFGVFIRFTSAVATEQEIEGLIHISELDWNIIEHPQDMTKIGDKIKAKIIDVSNGRVSLSLKALKPDPWQELSQKYKKGDLVQGAVYKHTPYGAFVKVDQYFHGLCPLNEKLILGQTYQFEIDSLSVSEHRINLKLI